MAGQIFVPLPLLEINPNALYHNTASWQKNGIQSETTHNKF